MALDRWDTCFLISKMKILDRSEPNNFGGGGKYKRSKTRIRQSSLVHDRTEARQNYLPIKSEKVVQYEAENIIANNYLKRKQMCGGKKRRKLKRPILFPDAYTNRDVMQIPCFTFPR